MYSQHGFLNYVGGGSLHRCVDGAALCVLPALGIACVYLRKIQAATENRFDIAELAGRLADIVHVRLDARVTIEIQIDVFLRLTSTDAELLTETEGRHAVHQSKIDGLGRASLIIANCIEFYFKHLCRRRAVYVEILGECM